jgi:hypothetical protein
MGPITQAKTVNEGPSLTTNQIHYSEQRISDMVGEIFNSSKYFDDVKAYLNTDLITITGKVTLRKITSTFNLQFNVVEHYSTKGLLDKLEIKIVHLDIKGINITHIKPITNIIEDQVNKRVNDYIQSKEMLPVRDIRILDGELIIGVDAVELLKHQ